MIIKSNQVVEVVVMASMNRRKSKFSNLTRTIGNEVKTDIFKFSDFWDLITELSEANNEEEKAR